jgi:hypothetical protein
MRKDLVQLPSQTLRNYQISGKQGIPEGTFIGKIRKALTKYSPNPRVKEVHWEVRRKTKLYLKPWFAWANHVFWMLQSKRGSLQLLHTHCRFVRTDSSAFWKPLPGSSTSYSRQ